MPIDIQRFAEYKPIDSITYLGDVSSAKDYQSPYSFSTWLTSFKQFNETPEIYLNLYRKYLSTWYQTKNNILLNNQQTVVLSYISIFYDLKLTYFTADERRFLTTLDYTNRQDIDIAIPFFARKIKQICQQLSDLREVIKSQPVKLNLVGTTEDIQKQIFDTLQTSFNDSDLQPLFLKDNITQTDISNNVRVLIEELYDDTDYYNNTECNEVLDIEANLYLDITQSILKVLSSVEYILPDVSEYLTFVPLLNPTNLEYLYDKDFISTVNDGLSSNLNLNNLAKLGQVFAGSNFYYLSTNSLSEVVSGDLFATTSESSNEQNIFNLKFAVKQLTSGLYTAKDVGGYFLPQYIGLLNYNPIQSNYNVIKSQLPADTLIVYPDPKLYPYGNSVIAFTYNTNSFKHSPSDQYIYGDIKDSDKLPGFKGYQSYTESLQYFFNNVSKPTDSVGFFADKKDNIWLNPDVYDNAAYAIFPVNDRQTELLIDNTKDIIKFRSDVYGNSYALYKQAYKVQNLTPAITQTIICLHLDGFQFNYPNNSGIDFDYNVTTPPIDGYTRSGVVLATYNQVSTVSPSIFGTSQIPMFQLSGTVINIFGGSFTDDVCNIVISENDDLSGFYSRDVNYYDSTLSGNNTIYTTITGLSANVDIYKKRNILDGEIYVRTGNNTIIQPISSALSANFVRYPQSVYEQLIGNVIDFDIIYDCLIIETTNYKVVEKITYDYDNNRFISDYAPIIYMQRSDTDLSINKFGDHWFNEKFKNVLFFNTIWDTSLSGNNKVVYPEVYKLELSNYSFKKIYPVYGLDSSQFTLSGYLDSYYNYVSSVDDVPFIFNLQNVDKPVITYSYESDVYTMTSKVYDNAGAYAILEYQFKFTGGSFDLVSNKIYFTGELIRDESYSNDVLGTFLDYITPAIGLNIGVIDQNLGVYKF